LTEKGFNTQDMGERFLRWCNTGHWAAHGRVFDIGIATQRALDRISMGMPSEEAGGRDLYSNGNGSLMRILPVVLASLDIELIEFADRIQRASAITHGHPRSQMACVFHGLFVRELMAGHAPPQALSLVRRCFRNLYEQSSELSTFRDLLEADLASWPKSGVRSGGYVMETLTASIWCLLTTSSFSECVLKAVNLGDDTDTTGCVTGGLAGVYYGVDAIPAEWIASLPQQAGLKNIFQAFLGNSMDGKR
jgi:ADP-ribosylglycohydrolase